jgi:hypothetical protein
MIASTAMQAVGAIQQGNAANAAAQANARQYEAQAAIRRQNAAAKDDQVRRDARAKIGSQLAASAEAGGGINADALRSSIYDAEMDSSVVRYEGELEAAGLNDQAAMARWEGKQRKQAGYLNAAGAVLNGGQSYYRGKKEGIF